MPTQVRAEGLTERMGDIILQCSGSNPGAVLSGNLSVFLAVSITNRIDSNSSNLTHDAVLSINLGNGFVPTGIAGQISNQLIAFNGINLTVPPSGMFSLKVSNLRGDAFQLGAVAPQAIHAQIAFGTPVSIPVDQSFVVVAYPQLGLFANLNDHGITCVGSPVPSSLSVPNLFAAGTVFTSTRVTEGFASAFQPRQPGEDNGTRFIVKFSGFPANAHVYVPSAVAGSDALSPTSGGDLGQPQSPGQYVTGSGTLLLQMVAGADANGAGGFLVPLPVSVSGPITGTPAPTGVVNLTGVSEVPLSNGSGFAVYEVVDSNPAAQESAQFPAFIGISNITAPAIAQESVTFAPVSNVTTASTTAPITRFQPLPPPSDCSLLGDCGASYFPHLNLVGVPATFKLTATAGGDATTDARIPIQNSGGGLLSWMATVAYQQGSGWLTLSDTSGGANTTLNISATAKNLTAGTYSASVTVDAGAAGVVTIPIVLTVTAAPPPTTPPTSVVVSQVINSATLDATPLVSGSLGTLKGSHLSGKNVAVTFDGMPGTIMYDSDSQINLQLPDLGAKSQASMVVTVDGLSSAPQMVVLSPAWPSVFANGILNQDNSVNGVSSGAPGGSVIAIWATGIPASATVSVQIAGHKDLVPQYAGPAPDLPGIQQVNVAVPDDLSGMNTQIIICATTGGQQYCSAGSPLTIQ